ncbi:MULTISPECIES: sn-glycerol-3-phosphate ABC transporter ATP-binding protein UgpC [unclassified Paenibacillus]|uniref:ABC transporter ATP-binding protein n=1 Tax=unclassified Paenibacillus TaxID=185978 RepID=UPI0009541876|nr:MULTISPECIES: sn-glycerol-3-phosphate ABC transporter ATP-binding protein UgpC [unclassified Paenibacillus]ASS66136.1 sn-glycerol-3-phosphate ABC transporter ATP-binding protein UgpC [Paenibacillus sp. RUD330]SIQ11502.1 multiple sugar transport system ATP-binding protein [Paenibacillus sp. RU4X]SIQ32886.1 multiple sugar transport system ATP-binding protein [Paenibacillus sp. RU4T]
MGSITFNHVFKRYKGEARPAVDDFHLSIEEGEFLVLVGPSGCGKSTTLRMLAGLEEISSGELYMDGKFINYVSPKDRDIAMVFQNYALYPNLSVFENIALGLKLRKTAKHEIELRVNRVAKILEISHLLERKPSQLSGGQKQRVALGRAIAREPQVFLMDEPLSNLDAKLRAQTRAELIKLQSDLKRTTVYVTHDQVEAMTMGTRIVVMKDGVIQQVAPPRMLYDEPANLFVAGFIGSPQMNFIPGKIQREDGTLYFTNRRMKLPLPAEMERRLGGTDRSLRSVVLGVRPEHVRLSSALPEGEEGGYTAAVVQMKEETGADSYVYLLAGDTRVIARTDPESAYHPEEQAAFGFQMDKIHLFDESTGVSLRRERA